MSEKTSQTITINPGQVTQTITLPDGGRRDVLEYGRGLVTGSLAISCQCNGDMYVAVCERPGEAMTMAGTVMRFNYSDGSAHRDGTDATPLKTGIRSACQLMGIDIDAYQPDIPPVIIDDVRSPGSYQGEYLQDMRSPQPGFKGNRAVPQIGIDYVTHIGTLDALPALSGRDGKNAEFDTKPTWMNVSNIALVQEGDRILYRYTADDNSIIPKGTEVLNIGGMNLVEQLVERARDLPFRDAGFDGVTGFIRFAQSKDPALRAKIDVYKERGVIDDAYRPVTQTGQDTALFYTDMTQALQQTLTTPRER